MASTNTESTWDEWLREQLPTGVGYSWAIDNLVLELEADYGPVMVTIFWRSRYLEMGYRGSPVPSRWAWKPPAMTGRGWRERLLREAVERLREARKEAEEDV